MGGLATSPLPSRGSPTTGKIKKGPHVGGLATSPLPFRGSRSRRQNQKWLTCGWIGYITGLENFSVPCLAPPPPPLARPTEGNASRSAPPCPLRAAMSLHCYPVYLPPHRLSELDPSNDLSTLSP